MKIGKNKSFLIFIVVLLGYHLSFGQTITAESKELVLKFGFPELAIMDDLKYEDENGNKLLDADAACIISFSVKNSGKYPAKDVVIRPEELNGIKGIELPETVPVGEIRSGETKLVQIGMNSNLELGDGTASLVFYILEKGEERNLSVVYALGTASQQTDTEK